MSDDNNEGAGVPVAWQERQKNLMGWTSWYESRSTCTVGKTTPFALTSGGIPYEFRPLYATPPAVMPATPSDAVDDDHSRALQLLKRLEDAADMWKGWSGTQSTLVELKHAVGGMAQKLALRTAALSQTMQAEPAAGEQAGAVAHPEGDIPPVSGAERGLTRAERSMLEYLFSNMEGLSDKDWRDHSFRRATFDRLKSKLRNITLAAPGAAIAAREQEVDEATAMKGGRWVSADDIEHMTGELLSLATGDPYTPTKMVDAFHTLRAALASREQEAPRTLRGEVWDDNPDGIVPGQERGPRMNPDTGFYEE